MKRAPDAEARCAWRAVMAIFVIQGVLIGSWAARIPAIRERVGFGDGEQGIVLACLALGAILSMTAAGALSARYGSRVPTQTGLGLVCLAVAVVSLPATLPLLCALVLFFGLAHGALDVSMNAQGLAVERRYGRAILASFHGGFSGGALIGAALGALAAAVDLDVRAHLGGVGVACGVTGLLVSRRLLPSSYDRSARDEPVLVRPPRKLWPVGALAFACLLIEGASADWSAVYLHEDLGSSAAVAAIAYTAFSVTMTVGRFYGDRLVSRFGPVTVVRVGGTLGTVGFGLALLVGTPAAGIVGFACLGVGMASIVPIAFRSASLAPGISPGLGLAAVSTTGYLGFMAGPPLIGGVAEVVGLPNALVLVVLLAALVAILARATSEPARREAPAVAPA